MEKMEKIQKYMRLDLKKKWTNATWLPVKISDIALDFWTCVDGALALPSQVELPAGALLVGGLPSSAVGRLACCVRTHFMPEAMFRKKLGWRRQPDDLQYERKRMFWSKINDTCWEVSFGSFCQHLKGYRYCFDMIFKYIQVMGFMTS